MAERGGQMGLGAFLSGSGAHGGSWRHPQADADASLNFQRYRHYAQTLERGCFDALFLNDNVAVGTWTRGYWPAVPTACAGTR